MTPEQESRQEIDRQLVQTGWIVQDYRDMNISAGPGVAVREFPLATGKADYLLYVYAKALGGVEAKPEGHTLTGVEEQIVQVRRWRAQGTAALRPAPAVHLRIDGESDPVHKPAGPESPEPGGLHVPPARRIAAAGQPGRAASGQAAKHAAFGNRQAVAHPDQGDPEP